MIRIAIVEDDYNDQLLIKSYTDRFFREQKQPYRITLFSSGEEFLKQNKESLDILFLDIEMAELNGIETARLVRMHDQRVVLLFITNMVQYAVEGYQVDALDYILKPVVYSSFQERLKRAMYRLEKRESKLIEIKTDKGNVLIELNEILYIETEQKKVRIHTRQGDLKSSETMHVLEKKLKDYPFFRCHTSYLVNLNYIDTVHSSEMILKGERIPISKYRKKEFMEHLAGFMGGII